MLNLILKIPHPSLVDLVISAQLVIWGLLIKEVLHLSYAEEQKLRKQHISHHIKHHSGRFARCGVCIIRTDLVTLNQTDQDLSILPELVLAQSVVATDQVQVHSAYSDNLGRER